MSEFDVDDAFEDFMRAVNPEVAQYSVQYRESRRAFFAGAAVIYYHLLSLSECSDKVAMARMRQIDDQLMNFKTRLVEDKD
jgi:hypothetical protein